MYCILMDRMTKTFYMKPHEFYFYAYTSLDKTVDLDLDKTVRVVETECDTQKELTTILYNIGFTRGYLDGQLIILTSKDSYYYDRCPNELAFAQYLLTDNTGYLENIIDKKRLVTICKIEKDCVLFPTIQLGNGDTVILAYTELSRIPKELFDKYGGFRIVKMTFDAKCVVNDKFIAE